jgi:hypothetical protein
MANESTASLSSTEGQVLVPPTPRVSFLSSKGSGYLVAWVLRGVERMSFMIFNEHGCSVHQSLRVPRHDPRIGMTA